MLSQQCGYGRELVGAVDAVAVSGLFMVVGSLGYSWWATAGQDSGQAGKMGANPAGRSRRPGSLRGHRLDAAVEEGAQAGSKLLTASEAKWIGQDARRGSTCRRVQETQHDDGEYAILLCFRSGLIFTVSSGNVATNNHALQLHPNPKVEGGFFLGVDASSPVLLANFEGGALKSLGRNNNNRLYDLGPTAYGTLQDEVDGTKRYAVGFAKAAASGDVEKEWSLFVGGSDGTYSLRYQQPSNAVYGFMICAADHDLEAGPWYQLFYHIRAQNPVDFDNCEFVGVQTSVAPIILNGECNIGVPETE
ncbi:hypothetical protein NUW58_g4351 [Xylaria curta]|uniref:Uncharacterized protein n=1 Tax=Xylaria curta TaxID=42375 RepID=A0ACC1P915_9PEZI|nr:hypothetical protein NUW58_g4351 [Xylaria curta]